MLANKARTRRFNERLMWMCVTIAQRNDLCRAQAKQRTALEQLRIQVAYNFHSKKNYICLYFGSILEVFGIVPNDGMCVFLWLYVSSLPSHMFALCARDKSPNNGKCLMLITCTATLLQSLHSTHDASKSLIPACLP